MSVDIIRFLLAIALAASAPAMAESAVTAAVMLTGTVIDVGVENAASNGIPGVAITVKNARGRTVASGVTDAKGRYEIEARLDFPPLSLYFEKLYYQMRPTELKLSRTTAAEQKPVEMIREAASAAYYRVVAARAADTALSPAERQQRIAMVVELPPADKSRVIEEVKRLAAVPALEQIQVAEKSKAIETNVKSKLLADSAYPSVKVNADASSGTVQLSGVVESSEQKLRASDLAQSVRGVSRVLNGLSIAGHTGGSAAGAKDLKSK